MCRHKWSQLSKTYNPSRVISLGDGSVSMTATNLRELLHGFTVIEFWCSKCGNKKHTYVEGRIE